MVTYKNGIIQIYIFGIICCRTYIRIIKKIVLVRACMFLQSYKNGLSNFDWIIKKNKWRCLPLEMSLTRLTKMERFLEGTLKRNFRKQY